MKNLLIGITGGSGSGKTFLAYKLLNAFGADRAMVLSSDSYYKDLAHLTAEEKTKVNFDHPEAMDKDLFVSDIDKLASGRAIQQPIYDFKTSGRAGYGPDVEAKEIIIVEGLFLFCLEDIFKRLDLSIFLEVDEDIRLERRIHRDVRERGRTLVSVIEKMNKYVLPMHAIHIEPFKEKAQMVINNNRANLDVASERLKGVITKRFFEAPITAALELECI